ncbi:MAG: PAS domain-containing protein [Rhodospirillales bacterium]|nr:PAS domain-containing protein [Rhodospirillales bacterium]
MQPVQELTVETITNPKIVRMYDYWSSKCAGRMMPSRSDIDALELRDCLGNLCLIEVTDDTPRRFRFRIDGSNLASLTGFDMTGKFVDQMPEPGYRDFVTALYERVVLTREPVFLANHEEWEGYGIEVVSATLPLSTYGFRVDGILDAVFPVRSLD